MFSFFKQNVNKFSKELFIVRNINHLQDEDFSSIMYPGGYSLHQYCEI